MVRPNPLALIDIDGVISLFGFEPGAAPEGQFLAVEGILHYISSAAGEHLRRLSACFELVWCSGWEEKANEHLPDLLGLPHPPDHLTFDAVHEVSAHWKLGAIDAFAGPARPVAWVDDAHSDVTRRWAAQRPGPTLLVDTDPPVGLTGAHVDRLLKWARSVGE